VLRHDGVWYLVPECAGARQVRLYRATAFPLAWEPVSTLVSGAPFVDPTLAWLDGHGYLFAGIGYDTLRLFWSDRLEHGWREHPQSPLVTDDLSRARPAGRLLELGGRRYRPAQDCRQRYGEAVTLHEIVALSPSRYVERPVDGGPVLHAHGATWARLGMHHLDAHPIEGTDRHLAVYDGYGRRRWCSYYSSRKAPLTDAQ
jgi:hypothetical protein